MGVNKGLTPLGDAVLEGLCIVEDLAVAQELPMVEGPRERVVFQAPLVVEDLPVVEQRSYLKVGTNVFSGGNTAHAPAPSQLGLTKEIVGQG